ncbi:tandem-95 repeat protein [Magnetovibrio sp.]|uniref:tandem-95 repeat protein n=1 Tax=Magnetovibrio sp. TaxID=2024836 RepID=UPI002F94BAAC
MLPMIFRAPADEFASGSDAMIGGEELFVQATEGEVVLPDGFNPAEAAFERIGPDLMLTAPDGTQVLVADFFMMETPPDLLSTLGARVVGGLAVRLAGSAAPGMVAGEFPETGEVIGRVTDINGEVTVIRADGTRATLQNGDAVLQGDILETSAEGAIGILLADGASLSMGANARMVLDEMVYDPGTQEGSIALSVMKGIFTMVSGEVAKVDPEAMLIHTPVATIGIRGTQIGLDLSNGRDLSLVMMEEADGFVGEVMIVNAGGAMTLNEAYHAVTISSFDAPPMAAPMYTHDDVINTFGGALSHLPMGNANANDYGLRAAFGADLADFETAAGTAGAEEPVSEEGLATFEAEAEEVISPDTEIAAEGLADFDMVAAEVSEEGQEPSGEFVTDAGDVLTAEELASEAAVVFGEELKPLEPEEHVVAPQSEGGAPVAPEPAAEPATETVEPVVAPVLPPEPVNVAPVAEPGTMIVAEDNVFSGQLSASDLEGGKLTFDLADDGAPSNGTVTINPDGTFTYTPNADFGGSDSFTYMVTDDAGAMAMATVSVTITPVADVPQLAVADVSGVEDSAIALTLAAVMPSGTTETVASLTISGVPEGASLSAGTDNGDGTWTLSPDQLSGLNLTPPQDYSGTIALALSATSTDGATALRNFTLHVGPVADQPQLAVVDASGAEDSAIALTIAAAMPGGTGETIDNVVLSGLPEGAFLSAGTDNGDGTWTLSPGELSGLTLIPPMDYNGAFNLGVSVTSSDGGVSSDTFAVTVNPVADAPVIAAADVSGAEDGAIALTLAAAMPAGTSETIDYVTVVGVPDGAVLSAGTDNGNGTWTLSPDQLAYLSLTPPADYNGTFNLGLVAVSTDGSTSTGNFNVAVEPSADVPQLAVADAYGVEDGAIALTLAATMAADTTETLDTITITGVPDGASLSAGMDNGDGTWTLSPNQLTGLTLTPPVDYNGTFSLGVVATSSDGGTASGSLAVEVEPSADLPQLAVADALGVEDGTIALTFSASMPADTTETLDTITIEGVPDGASLSAGTDNGDGTWTLTPEQMSGLTLTPPQDYHGTFALNIVAVSTDGSAATSPLGVTVTPVADTPVIALADVSGAEDSTIALTIATSMPGGTSETVDSITISGVPDGAMLNTGTDNGDGTWTLSPDQLAGLTLTPPQDFNGVIDIGVSVTSSDGGVSTDSFAVSVNPVADLPVLAVADVSGSEDATIALTLAASMPADTSETVDTITITGVPDGAVLSAGTDNNDGTWTLSPDELAGLTLTPPTDYNGTLSLGVIATSTDGATTSGNFDIVVEPLADVPQLAVADAVGAEDGTIALTLAASMPADTTEAVYTITIEGVPDGASLNAGLDNGDGTWTLTPDLIDGLTLSPPQDFNGTINLTVIAISTDGGTATAPLGVTVTPIADTPIIAVADAIGSEDSSITLAIAASMPGDTTETIDSVVISGVPVGAVLSAGTDNGDGTWTLYGFELDGLTITPPQDFNGVFDLGVSVISTDGSVSSDSLSVNVGSVSDIPVIAVGDVAGAEDNAIALTIAASMPAGTTETLESLAISGIPDGASLSAGTDNGDGSWSVSAEDLAGLSLTPPANYSGVISLNVTAVSSDGGTATTTFNAAVAPVADVPVLQVSDVVVTIEAPPGEVIDGTPSADEIYGTMGSDVIDGGSGHDVIYGDSEGAPEDDGKGGGKGDDKWDDGKGDDKWDDGKGDDKWDDDDHGHGHGYGHGHDEGGGEEGGGELPGSTEPIVIALDVDAALTDIDGSEALSIEISNVPDGGVLSLGTDNGDGTWSLLADDLDNLDDLTLTLPAGSDLENFELGVSASASELATGETATTTATIDVTFDGGTGGGDDYIDGGAGSDEIYGGGGDDTIIGGTGADQLYGESGDDTISGDEGADYIDGGAGDDILSGGAGADEFVFHAGDGDDIVLDLGHQDVLRFEGQEFNMDDFILQSDGENDVTTITFGADTGVSVTLNDVYVEDTSSYTVTQDGDSIVVTFDKDSTDQG